MRQYWAIATVLVASLVVLSPLSACGTKGALTQPQKPPAAIHAPAPEAATPATPPAPNLPTRHLNTPEEPAR